MKMLKYLKCYINVNKKAYTCMQIHFLGKLLTYNVKEKNTNEKNFKLKF